MAHESMSFRLPATAAWDQRFLPPSELAESAAQPRPRPQPRCLSPLTTGILPENLRLLDSGRGVAVRLWNQWPRLLAGLPALGEVLVITCSECAVLGKYTTYPELRISADGSHAADPDGEYDLETREWQTASALHLRTDAGHSYGIEFLGPEGQTFHKVCLNAESNFEAFLEWVQIHQALETETTPDLTFDDSDEPLFVDENVVPADAHRILDPSRLTDWLQAATIARLPIRALVGNRAVVQSHCFVPRSVRPQGPWIFCSSDEAGLHLDPAKIAHLVLHRVAIDQSLTWTIKAYGPQGQLGLALTPTAPAHLPAWDTLLGQIFPELHHC